MPISKENKARYPKNWKAEVRPRILDRANHCCEGSPDYPDCRAPNYANHPVTGSKVVLTIAHLDHTPENCDDDNLRAWCQRCHLNYDKEHHQKTKAANDWKKHLQGLPQSELIDLLIFWKSFESDAERYRHLREKDLETIYQGGVFAGLTPANLALSGDDLDKAIDEEMR